MNYSISLPRNIITEIYSWRMGGVLNLALLNAIRNDADSHVSGPFGTSVGMAPTHMFRWQMADPADASQVHQVTINLRPGQLPGEMIAVGAFHNITSP